jgi:hypothetical protein
MSHGFRQIFPLLSYEQIRRHPTTSMVEPQQIVNATRRLCGGTTMTPALIAERQRTSGREPYRGTAQFAPVKGIIAATLLSLLIFWLPLFVVLSLHRF